MERKKTGLTIIELLIVLGIIAILTGLLIPALSVVRNTARDAKQRAQFNTIELGLSAFKSDYGDYPQSNDDYRTGEYCGAQTLSEALLGWDLLGFHPNTAWRIDGYDAGGGNESYDPRKERDINPADGVPDTLNERKGPYLEVATTPVFRLYDLFGINSLAGDTFVICDAFPKKKVTLANGRTVIAGTPVLYYRANTSSKSMNPANPDDFVNQIYNANDNLYLINLGSLTQGGRPHELGDDDGVFNPFPPYSGYSGTGEFFYNPGYGIIDPRVTAASGRNWPYRPDSYILISAGADGLYGTNDDIRNFGN